MSDDPLEDYDFDDGTLTDQLIADFHKHADDHVLLSEGYALDRTGDRSFVVTVDEEGLGDTVHLTMEGLAREHEAEHGVVRFNNEHEVIGDTGGIQMHYYGVRTVPSTDTPRLDHELPEELR